MDHLPYLSKPVCTVPSVTFLEVPGLVYQRPIDTFKTRDPKVKQQPDDTSNTEYSCFVQQWLYFGVLSDFFEIWDLAVAQSDFIVDQHGSKSITNRLLADYMVACTGKEFNQDQSLLRDKRPTNTVATYTTAQRKEAVTRMEKSLELFRYVHSHLQRYVISTAVDPAIWDSVILLTASLIRFWQILYGSIRPETVSFLTPDFSDFRFRSITDMRSNKQFCVHEQRLILGLVDNRPNDIAFFSLLGPNEDDKSHNECQVNECKAYQIQAKESYQTVHTVDCDGTCASAGLDPDFWMSKTEGKGRQEQPQVGFAQNLYHKLPDAFSKQAVALTFENNKLNTHNVPLMMAKATGWIGRHVESATMVAFSHVWADGLGNPGSNSLPTCQLARLQKLANSAYANPKKNVPFWFDTLLIPVKREGLDEVEAKRQTEAKTNALRDMEWVYKYASKVLVLDRRLFEVDCGDMQPEEIGARIMCSVWSRRLWTLQEGCSKSKTMFKFRNQWVHWPDLHDHVLDRGGLTNWSRKGSKLPAHHRLAKAQSISSVVHKKGGMNSSLSGDAPDTYTSPMIEAKMGANKRLYKVTSQNWHSIYRFLEELTIDWSGSARAAALPRCIRGMYYRNCSVKNDEALVLASMISETPGSAAKLTQKCEHAEDRYRILLTSLKEVPEDFLFIDQRRHQEVGERWVPKSLLGASAADYRPPNRSEALPSRHLLTPRYLRRRVSILCPRTKEGIEVGLRGLKVLPCPQVIKAPFRFKWEEAGFEVTLKDPGGEANSISALPQDQYAIIFERAASFASDWMQAHAVVVSITEWYNESRWGWTTGGRGEFKALAMLTRLEAGEFEMTDLPLVTVEEPTTKWTTKVRPIEINGRLGSLQSWIIG